MKDFPAYSEVIGLRGVVAVGTDNLARFIPVGQLEELFPFVTLGVKDKILEAVANYDCYSHYLRLQPDVERNQLLLYLVSQDQVKNNTLDDVLQSLELRHPDRNNTWFKALVAVEASGLLTLQEKLSFFKLRATEYNALEPHIIDAIVENNRLM